MKKSRLGKFLMLGVAIILVLTSFAPAVTSDIQNEKEKTIKINVFDTTTEDLTKHYVSEEEAKEIIALIEGEISQESFAREINGKLEVLNNIGIISPETRNYLANSIDEQQKRIYKNHLISENGLFFDVLNVFNGIFFGLKGEKEYTLLELNIYQFPFFNTNITAQFSFLSKFAGSGCVYTLGTLGFKYIYDFNLIQYEFPHFSNITGSVIGFTGILLELDVGDTIGEKYEGTYIIGIGMDIATIWSIQ